MQIHYLEIVTKEFEAVCKAYAAANEVQFGEPDTGLCNARTTALSGGGLVGVRAPMYEAEDPVEIPGHGTSPSTCKVASTTASGSGKRVPARDAANLTTACSAR